MKILYFGDSITEANRDYQAPIGDLRSYGIGYVRFVAGELLSRDPNAYTLINQGIGGENVVELYARVKTSVWNQEPDFLNIMVGVNDVLHENVNNGVELDRFDKVYRMLVEETMTKLPKVKILLCAPFLLLSESGANKKDYEQVKIYAQKVKEIAKDYKLHFLSLQEILEEKAKIFGVKTYFFDGIHPSIVGAKLIADQWIKKFDEIMQNA